MMYKLLIIIIILVGSSGLAIGQAKSKDSKNIVDYLQLLPDLEGFFLPHTLKSKNTKFDVKDTKNGYARIIGDFDGYIEAALFRKKNGSPIVVVGETFCGPACGTDLFIFTYQKGKMVLLPNSIMALGNVTEIERILIEKSNNSVAEMVGSTYKLPRYGTTIKYFDDETEILIYEIKWENDKFVVDRSIMDLYLLSPNNLLMDVYKAKSTILINDEKNGYLLFDYDGTSVEVGLFRKKDSTPILVTVKRERQGGKNIYQEIEANQFKDENWLNITKDILPDLKELEKKIYQKNKNVATYGYEYSIPRHGTTIRIVEGSADETIYKLIWKNDRFVIQ